MFHVYGQQPGGIELNDTGHEFTDFDTAREFAASEVHNGHVVIARKFDRMSDVAVCLIREVSDDAFISLVPTKVIGWFELCYIVTTPSVKDVPTAEPRHYMRLTSPADTDLGNTPIMNGQLADGSYGLYEYCEQELGGQLGKPFAEAVERQLLKLLLYPTAATASVTWMGFSAELVTME